MSACVKCGYSPDAVVVHTWQFTLPLELESLNARRVNVGATRWSYKRKRDGWAMALRAIVPRAILAVEGKRRVTLTRLMGKGQRAFDRDNLVGGAKGLVDAMVRVGLLLGDDAEHAEIHYDQERAPEPGVRVLIEELAAVTSGLTTQCGKERT